MSSRNSWGKKKKRKSNLFGSTYVLSGAPQKRESQRGVPFFGRFVFFRQELRVGAILREQNALPNETLIRETPVGKGRC